MRRLSDAEALKETERLIEVYRVYRSTVHSPEHLSYLALKMFAEDLRGRQPQTISETRQELQRAIDAVFASKTGLGYEMGKLQRLAEELIGCWPTVRQALTAFAIDAEGFYSMATAPLTAREVVLRIPKKNHPGFYRVIAHWADSDGQGEQPAFKGWFRDTGDGFAEVSTEPTGWKPL